MRGSHFGRSRSVLKATLRISNPISSGSLALIEYVATRRILVFVLGHVYLDLWKYEPSAMQGRH